MTKSNLVAISGRKGVGKDLVGRIIEAIDAAHGRNYTQEHLMDIINHPYPSVLTDWEIKKFAGPLKDMVCIMLGCTREQLEDRRYKETPLNGWDKWLVYFGENVIPEKIFSTSAEAVEYRNSMSLNLGSLTSESFWVKKETLSPRKILQLLGTECGRDIIHPDIWIKSVFSEHKKSTPSNRFELSVHGDGGYKWIITDMRFPNELKAVKQKGGFSIRVNRGITFNVYGHLADGTPHIEQINAMNGSDALNSTTDDFFKSNHAIPALDHEIHKSETQLDKANFDYVIDNSGSVEDLIKKVEEILRKENIIT